MNDDQEKERRFNEWLVVNGQLGDRRALDQLLQRWQGRLFAYAMRRLGDRGAAQEVVQECLLGVVRRLHSLREPAAFPAWCYRLLERRCADYLRRMLRQRRQERQIRDESRTDPVSVDFSTQMEQRLTLEQVLSGLDSTLMAVVKLYYQESLSVGEIAGILKIPAGTVKSRLFYARRILAAALEDAR